MPWFKLEDIPIRFLMQTENQFRQMNLVLWLDWFISHIGESLQRAFLEAVLIIEDPSRYQKNSATFSNKKTFFLQKFDLAVN